jgi:hypothetical protein
VLRRFKSCPSHVSLTDPAPFYDAALTGVTGAALILHDYPLAWRFPMLLNATLTTIRKLLFTNTYPTPSQRDQAIAMFVEDYPGDPEFAGVIDQLIEATFNPVKLADLMANVDPQDLGGCAIMVPPTIAVRYPWKPGERDDYIAYLCRFDHTAFTN